MEKNSSTENVGGSNSHSWWLDNHNRPQHQSLWLQSTLSEFGRKIKTMLTLIEDDGDTFAMRAEMFYQKRPQLINLLEDLHRSFCALADKYDQLKSDQSIRASSSSNSLSQSFQHLPSSRGNQEITLLERHHPHDDLDNSSESDHFNFQLPLNGSILGEDFVPIDQPCVPLGNEDETTHEGGIINYGKHELYDDLRRLTERAKMCNHQVTHVNNMSKLFEDNFQRQAELVTKVDATVKELRAHIDKLANEKRALKNYCAQSKVEIRRSRSHISRLKESILKKLLR